MASLYPKQSNEKMKKNKAKKEKESLMLLVAQQALHETLAISPDTDMLELPNRRGARKIQSDTAKTSSQDISIQYSTLCTACKTSPWGFAGWKTFHDYQDVKGSFEWTNVSDSLQRSIQYRATVEEFYTNIKSCAWCFLLRDALELPPDRRLARLCKTEGFIFTLKFDGNRAICTSKLNTLYVSAAITRKRNEFSFRSCTLSVLARPDTSASHLFLAPRETNYKNRDFDHDTARGWLTDCRQQHGDRCNPHTSDTLPTLPTRVLQIMANPHNSDEPEVLIRASLPHETGQYACLSYTWGNKSQYNFSKIAKAFQEKKYSSELFPPLFTDAITVVFKLGITFLWIDALCIWQDDQSDLIRELSVMDRYYAEATVIIQSSGTKSVAEGFLGKMRNSQVASMLASEARLDVDEAFIKIPFHATNAIPADASKVDVEGLAPEATQDLLTDEVEKNHVEAQPNSFLYVSSRKRSKVYREGSEIASSRAWIFQEQILCRRLLIFPSGGGMIYSCDTSPEPKDDGNITYWLSTRNQKQSRLGRVWSKERLMSENNTPFEYIALTSSIRSEIDDLRKLVEAGNNAELRMSDRIISIDIVDAKSGDAGWSSFGKLNVTAKAASTDNARSKNGVKRAVRSVGEILQLSVKSVKAAMNVGLQQRDNEKKDPAIGHNVIRIRPAGVKTVDNSIGGQTLSEISRHTASITMGPSNDWHLFSIDPPQGFIFASGLIDIWKELVSEYCTRLLTKPEDKLVAVAALASTFEAFYGTGVLGQYCAGIWRNFAAQGLLWSAGWLPPSDLVEVPNSLEEDALMQGYDLRAPTWSWAAVGKARYFKPELYFTQAVDYFEPDFEVIQIEVEPAPDSPARGAVVNGFVKLDCLITTAWWGWGYNEDGEAHVQLFTTGTGAEHFGSDSQACPDHIWLWPKGTTRQHVELVLGRRYVHGYGHNKQDAMCLLVRRTRLQEGYRDLYERVGFATTVFKDFELQWRPRFCRRSIRIV